MKLEALVKQVAEVAESVHVRLIPLKGVALHLCRAAGVSARPANDLDILVPEPEGSRLFEELCSRGWAAFGGDAGGHHFPPLARNGWPPVEIHRMLPFVSLDGKAWATADSVLAAGLAKPSSGYSCALFLPSPSLLTAHALAHALGQDWYKPGTPSRWQLFGDLLDLYDGRDDLKDLVALTPSAPKALVARWRLIGALDLAQALRGGEDVLTQDRRSPRGRVLRHMIRSEIDRDYQLSLRLGRIFCALNNPKPVISVARLVLRASVLNDSQVSLIYPGTRSALRHAAIRLARPLDLLVRLGRYLAAAVRASARRWPPPASGRHPR